MTPFAQGTFVIKITLAIVRTENHNSRDKISHMLRHLIEIRLPNDWKIVS